MTSLAPRLPDVAHPRMLVVSLGVHGLLLLAIAIFSFTLPTQKTPQWNVSRVKIVENAHSTPAIEKPRQGPVRAPAAPIAESLDQAVVPEPIVEKRETIEPRVIPAPPKDSIPVPKKKRTHSRVEAPKPKEKKPPEPTKPKQDPQEVIDKRMAALKEKYKDSPDDKRLASSAPTTGGQGSTDEAAAADQELGMWLEGAKREINSRWTVFADARRIPKPTVIGVKIARDGKIADAWVDVGSGDEAFDRSALRAVSQAAPLLPPLSPAPRQKIVQAGGLALRFTSGGMQ